MIPFTGEIIFGHMAYSSSALQVSSYLKLPSEFYTLVHPEGAPAPEMVLWNEELAQQLFSGKNDEGSLLPVLSGNNLPNEITPVAQAYAGHQFGYFNMLGDGRAVLLGELHPQNGEAVDLQLKGSGRTPYSRRGDGLATVGSMLREYLMSEAVHHLGIPTTRSLAVVKTGEKVYRQTVHEGGVLSRIASSHLRVGTFEFARQFTSSEHQKELLDYTIQRLYPELERSDHPALALIEQVMERQIHLITEWMRVGFIHGVMNTDNMSIAGETIDYGPCAFMNAYDPQTVFSSIDTEGRYAFGNQPRIASWNLAVFASALLPQIADAQPRAIELAKSVIDQFEEKFAESWNQMMFRKLGILSAEESDKQLVQDLLKIMHDHEADYTNTFVALQMGIDPERSLVESEEFQYWKSSWENRISATRIDSVEMMAKSNPVSIPRNFLVEKAITEAESGDLKSLHTLLETLKTPYAGREELQAVPVGYDDRYQTFCGT